MPNQYNVFLILFGAIFIGNIVLIKFIALCSFFGVSNRFETSIGMGLAVIFVMLMASTVSYFIYHYILFPHLVYLRTAVFILVIAGLVQFEEMLIRKMSPTLYRALGIYLPLITTNCAILGVSFLVIDYDFTLIKTIVFAFGISIGYSMAIILLAGIRERIETAPIPKAFKGYPIVFLTAALMSLAFLGFGNLFGVSL